MRPRENALVSADASSGASVLVEWFAKYRPALYAYFLRRTRNKADSEDLVQDVFVRLSRLDPASDIRDIEAFIFRTAANLLRDRVRRRQAQPIAWGHGEGPIELADGVPGPERVLEAKIELGQVVQALGTLSERTRSIFILRRLEQMRCQEIADLYGISVKAVEHHIARALAHLARTVDRK